MFSTDTYELPQAMTSTFRTNNILSSSYDSPSSLLQFRAIYSMKHPCQPTQIEVNRFQELLAGSPSSVRDSSAQVPASALDHFPSSYFQKQIPQQISVVY